LSFLILALNASALGGSAGGVCSPSPHCKH
jgi:hypothetical protein